MYDDRRPKHDEQKKAVCSLGGLSHGGVYSHETPGRGVLTTQWLGRYLRIATVPEGEQIYRVGQMVRLRLIGGRTMPLILVDSENYPKGNALFFALVPTVRGLDEPEKAVLERFPTAQDSQD